MGKSAKKDIVRRKLFYGTASAGGTDAILTFKLDAQHHVTPPPPTIPVVQVYGADYYSTWQAIHTVPVDHRTRSFDYTPAGSIIYRADSYYYGAPSVLRRWVPGSQAADVYTGYVGEVRRGANGHMYAPVHKPELMPPPPSGSGLVGPTGPLPLNALLQLEQPDISTGLPTATYLPLPFKRASAHMRLQPHRIYPLRTPNTRLLGMRQYELTDHLGNVRTLISDRKLSDASAYPLITDYRAQVLAHSNYYPFGAIMPGISYNAGDYRFGFNGQEKDNEVAGNGNSYTAEFWQYDARLGRRWNIDPVDKPWMSSYHAFSNKPIWNIDPNGADDHGYTIDKSGKVEKVDETGGDEYDVLYTKEDYDAGNKDNGLVVNNTSILSSLTNENNKTTGNEPYRYADISGNTKYATDDMFNVFKAAADYTDGEWELFRYRKNGEDRYWLGSFAGSYGGEFSGIRRNESKSPNYKTVGLSNVIAGIHSHPFSRRVANNIDVLKEVYFGMGYLGPVGNGHRYDANSDVGYVEKGSFPYEYYVYETNMKAIFHISQESVVPQYIRPVTSGKSFYFGTLNHK